MGFIFKVLVFWPCFCHDLHVCIPGCLHVTTPLVSSNVALFGISRGPTGGAEFTDPAGPVSEWGRELPAAPGEYRGMVLS